MMVLHCCQQRDVLLLAQPLYQVTWGVYAVCPGPEFMQGQLREGLKKKIVEFSSKCLTPPPLVGKKKNLLAMKQILYDMVPLTLVRWPL